MFNILIVLLIY